LIVCDNFIACDFCERQEGKDKKRQMEHSQKNIDDVLAILLCSIESEILKSKPENVIEFLRQYFQGCFTF
jgi:hypothetical protein